MVALDGAQGEGGGGLVRCALAMSALTQQPLKITDVRGGTRFPGVDSEDITIIQALAECCGAETTGAEVGSSSFTFEPTRHPRGLKGKLAAVRSESNRGPNALVVLNTLLPVLARSGVYSSVAAEGETYGLHSLGYDAFANTTLRALKGTGVYAFPSLTVGGFGRESQGEVFLDVEPSEMHGVQWTERGRLVECGGVIATARLSKSVADRAIAHLEVLARGANIPLAMSHSSVESFFPGCHITLWAHYERGFGGSAEMGAKSIRVEALAQSVFEELMDWMQGAACVDEYLADQVLVPTAIADGPSSFSIARLTQRFLTSVWVVKQFTPIHITVRGSEGEPGLVTVSK